MNIVISYPSVVTHYAPVFKDLFSPEGYSYFQKYLTGLILSDNKTVESINSLFVLDKRNQSSFNRFMNRQSFDLEKLNERRPLQEVAKAKAQLWNTFRQFLL